MALVCIATIGATGSIIGDRICYSYRDHSIDKLNTKLESGPAAGIYTTAEMARRYGVIVSTIEQLSDRNGELYIMGFCPWGYMCTNMKCSPYTAWRIMPDKDNIEGVRYYSLYPDKFPDTVLFLAEYDDTTKLGQETNPILESGSDWYQMWHNGKVMQELLRQGYKKSITACGEIYTR